MIPLKDLTFLIALKVDSQDRVDNLQLVLQYLQTNFDATFIISEQDTTPRLMDWPGCVHTFEKTEGFFNRQRGVNLAAKLATTPYIVHYDADILLMPKQIAKAVQLLKDDVVDIVYPYDGHFYDVPKDQHPKIKETNSTEQIDLNRCTLFNPHSVGGAVFFKTDVFWEGGGANENFKGLGYEDNEIFTRYTNLGYRIGRVTGPLCHLTHERKETSFNYNPHIEDNKREFFRINNMTKEQLKQEVSTWNFRQ